MSSLYSEFPVVELTEHVVLDHWLRRWGRCQVFTLNPQTYGLARTLQSRRVQGMAGPLRSEFAGASVDVTSRGNRRGPVCLEV